MADENLAEANEGNGESSVSDKMISQSHADSLVGKAKLRERERASQEIEKLRSQVEELKSSRPAIGGMESVNMDDMYKQFHGRLMTDLSKQQEAQVQKQREEEMGRVATEFYGKINRGKENYPDYDEALSNVDIASYPNLVYLANSMDNTADVMYELAKNPQKLANLAFLSERDVKATQYGLKVLADSIKKNQEAKSQSRDANAPLDRMQPSMTASDNGQPTIRDFKRKYRV